MGLTFEKLGTLAKYSTQTDANLKQLDSRVTKLESKSVKSVASAASVPTKTASAKPSGPKAPFKSELVKTDLQMGRRGTQSKQYHQFKAVEVEGGFKVTSLSSQRLNGEWVQHEKPSETFADAGAAVTWFVKRVMKFEQTIASKRAARRIEAVAAD